MLRLINDSFLSSLFVEKEMKEKIINYLIEKTEKNKIKWFPYNEEISETNIQKGFKFNSIFPPLSGRMFIDDSNGVIVLIYISWMSIKNQISVIIEIDEDWKLHKLFKKLIEESK